MAVQTGTFCSGGPFLNTRNILILASLIAIAALVAYSPKSAAALFGPENYWECILDQMPGSQNDIDALAVKKLCRQKFPDYSWRKEVPKKASGLFTDSATECLEEFASKTPSAEGQRELRAACIGMYEY